MGERELRAQLEEAQARVQRARTALEHPPDVADELASLAAEAERLETRRGALAPLAASAAQWAETNRESIRRATAERWSSVGRGVGRGGVDVLLSLGAGVVGVGAGTLLLLLGMRTFGESFTWWSALLGGPAWCWILYRLGRDT